MLSLAFATGLCASASAAPAAKPAARPAAKLTASQVIAKMDENQVFGSRRAWITMRIKKRGRIRVKKMISVSKGEKTSFSQFTHPSRDKGVKYLRLGDNLWMYLPSAEKTVKISGHMLRQSMMGSDFSYEDMLDNRALKDRYTSKIVKMEKVGKHNCYLIEMVQKKKGETYPKRKVWIDAKIFVPRKYEMYALSGRLMKVMNLDKVKVYGKRYYTTRMRMSNKLRKGTWTETILTKIQFKVALASRIFSLRSLNSED